VVTPATMPPTTFLVSNAGWPGRPRARRSQAGATRCGELQLIQQTSTVTLNPGVSASLAGSTALVSVFGRGQALATGLDAHLGVYASGGDRVGQCRVVAFGLVGVGLGEVGHGLVELA
jgi:hypothetical protein